MAQQSLMYVYDFTAPFERNRDEQIIQKWLNSTCKRWCFQLEKGEQGYEHYQGRCSFIKKIRLTALVKQKDIKGCHWSVTASCNKTNMFYVMKEETRIKGPWKSADKARFIPRHIACIKEWYPWQQSVLDISKVRDDRHINVIYDREGNHGKTTLALHMQVHGLARLLPYCNDNKELLQMVFGMPTSECYIIDLPRAINKKKLAGMFSAIESVKNGWVYDQRYRYQEKYFNAPVVWVFSNDEIDSRYLSIDRWIPWTINGLELTRLDSLEYRLPMDEYNARSALARRASSPSAPPPMKRQRCFFDLDDYKGEST